ncbi:MAG: hypothetical protein KGZ86_09005 [Candidatus Latescibacteria bacterium]|nr:hypothetical protein [Candidatus Latescibacterota bacterium]
MLKHKKYIVLALALITILISLNCAPGNWRWNAEVEGSNPAGFWAGLWHGIIVVITFIISLFNKNVGVYEANNYGWTYNLGFILGLFISVGGGLKARRRKKVIKYEWKDFSPKVEEKIREGVKAWVDESEDEAKKKEWEEIGNKVEEKIKRKLKEWADKE